MTAATTVRLGEVASINPKLPQRPAPDDAVSFVPMSAVDQETGVVSGSETRPFGEVSKGYTTFLDGDILVGKITPCFENGKIGHARLKNKVGVGSTEFHVVRPHPGRADARYLLHMLRQPWIRVAGERRMTGSAGQRRVPQEFVADLKVHLPLLEEQRRIADVLDRVDTLRAWRQQAVAELDALASSVFTELLAEVLNSSGCTSRNLGDVADIASGITKGRKAPAGSVREVPYLAVANVQDRRLDLSGVKYIEATDGEVERYRLRMDDLVLTEGGDPDKLGRGSLWRCEFPEAIHQNHIFRVRIDDAGRVHPVYLNWLISSAYGKRYFLRSAKQTTGIASINMSQLRRFPVAVPDYDVQKKFAEQVDGIERSKAVQRRALGELDALFASLQHRAFRGEL
ncbi:restriction endonuclease subunit S [Solwaraspora sp. WMMD406]|uniref:restriction endonuclease subunit S n=1 Tax=Solwaraspora sp. WMMD406 TaxID=3016095 RepID=UPI002416BCCC|nr:restriction endonuclease subunit S [Solwaraspora sp. WMMD406]MDG4764752.1 restriction endonuclease subunit S [Solwaraspora sp. WMMD406]